MLHNKVTSGNGFYVSLNDIDVGIYGAVTTALVFGQMQRFYILNGDHQAAYKPLIPLGFAACLDYFKQNTAQKNKRSD